MIAQSSPKGPGAKGVKEPTRSQSWLLGAVLLLVGMGCGGLLVIYMRKTTSSQEDLAISAQYASEINALHGKIFGDSPHLATAPTSDGPSPPSIKSGTEPVAVECTDAVWCNVQMPEQSLFRFSPPTDRKAWRLAQSQAAAGEPVLLKHIRKVFPHYNDFLDGEPHFRRYQELTDIFLDHKIDMLEELTHVPKPRLYEGGRRWVGQNRRVYEWEQWGHNIEVVPEPYDYRAVGRAPIVQVGYNVFSIHNRTAFFEGAYLGEAHVDLNGLTAQWRKVRGRIVQPFILMHAGNENWGLFSTEFPNRTVNWGRCCDNHPVVNSILEHPKTVAVFTNQHHNLTHPKLVSLPRGMPLFIPHRKKLIFDLQRNYAHHLRKESLVFAASSDWKHRPYISKCISQKFTGADALNASTYVAGDIKVAGRMTEVDYYRKLASARTVITLAGLGYDSYRLWETLTFGSVPVIEKGIGLDKTLWRLPALLVEDFDEVTPALLRTAYVEALYRANAGHFELERLTQSFWWTFVMNVSATMSQEAITTKFPPESEDSGFTRPWTPYHCGQAGELCGPGTKRTPRSSCGGQPPNQGKRRHHHN